MPLSSGWARSPLTNDVSLAIMPREPQLVFKSKRRSVFSLIYCHFICTGGAARGSDWDPHVQDVMKRWSLPQRASGLITEQETTDGCPIQTGRSSR